MATHVPMARVPFAPLDNPRLQHLASAKNRQNGIIASKSLLGDKSALPSKPTLQSPKRSFDLAIFDDFDSENVDPSAAKKSKSDSSKPSPIFSLAPSKSTMPPPPSRVSTPIRANMSSPRIPMTAPAGRSPTKRKSSGITKSRRTSAPFSRIDPPFASRSGGISLPFSLDAAISGTLTKSQPKSSGLTIQESMPQNWFFDIYEDTPDEEAANLMEHSTLTLDLSSDDESSKEIRDARGKENTPPEGYDAPTASRSNAAGSSRQTADVVRRKVATDEMDDGQRSPLSDLETDPFFPDGLDKDSHVVVNPTPEKTKLDVKNLFATPVPFTAGLDQKKDAVLSVVSAEGDVKGDIIVWEDSPEKANA